MIGLILCGGKGTRMAGVLPLGFPKVHVRVGGVPIIDYVEISARALGCPRPVWYGNTPDIGTVAQVQMVQRRERMLVFNGDTLLFGAGPEALPHGAGLFAICGLNRVTQNVEPAYYLVGGDTELSGRNLEDCPLAGKIETPTLSFIDCGTPDGLSLARKVLEG